ncbi:MAG: methylaspartate mutase, partial [Bacilli bacterium]
MESIVIGVIGADVHAVDNRIIEFTLENAGYNVVNVGVLSTQEDFINAAI